MAWNLRSTKEFDDWLASLADPEQAEVLAKVILLREFGPALRRPHADTLAGSKFENMKELRGRTDASVLRVAFAFDPNRQGVLLIGGEKQGVSQKRFYKSLIDIADRLYARHLASLKKGG